jgi:hypothetical protein
MPAMSEETGRFWATLFGGITAIGLVAGGFYSLIQYEFNRSAAQTSLSIQTANAKLEAQKPFYQAQLDTCLKASSDAAILANPDTHDKDDIDTARGDFLRLQYGPLVMVENGDVKNATSQFDACLAGKCDDARRRAVVIANACRLLVVQSWNVPLPEIFPAHRADRNN